MVQSTHTSMETWIATLKVQPTQFPHILHILMIHSWQKIDFRTLYNSNTPFKKLTFSNNTNNSHKFKFSGTPGYWTTSQLNRNNTISRLPWSTQLRTSVVLRRHFVSSKMNKYQFFIHKIYVIYVYHQKITFCFAIQWLLMINNLKPNQSVFTL